MADYKVILPYLSDDIHHSTFYPKSHNPMKVLIRHVPIKNTSSQMTTKRPSPDGSITTISMPLFLGTLPRSQKSQVFALTNLRTVIIKVETYKTLTEVFRAFPQVFPKCLRGLQPKRAQFWFQLPASIQPKDT
jgi:hypothetical protein